MRSVLILLAWLAVAGPCVAEPPAPGAPMAPAPGAQPVPGTKPSPPPTPEQAADAVLAAVRVDDVKALEAIASRVRPGPWLVADRLLARGEQGAAQALARARATPQGEALLRYVLEASRRPDDGELRGRYLQASAALADGAAGAALEALGAPAPQPRRDALTVQVAFLRGRALAGVRKLAESATAFARAGEDAEALGWLDMAAAAYSESGMCEQRQGRVQAALVTWEKGLAVAERSGRAADIGEALGRVGSAHVALRRPERGIELLRRAIGIFEVERDLAATAKLLGNLGIAQKNAGLLADALTSLERSTQLKEALADQGGVATNLGSLANVHGLLGNRVKALELHERALAMKEGLRDRAGAATELVNLGALHQAMGHVGKAIDCATRALEIFDASEDRARAGPTLLSLGRMYASRRQFTEALDLMERAARVFGGLGDVAAEADALRGIGTLHGVRGDPSRALEYHGRALDGMRRAADRAGEAKLLGDVGCDLDALGSTAEAIQSLTNSRELHRELRDPDGVARADLNLGNAEYGRGSYARALALYEQALEEADAAGSPATSAAALLGLANVHDGIGSYDRAVALLERALARFEALEDRAGMARALGNLGNVHGTQGSTSKALELHERALRIKRELGDDAEVALTLGNIGVCEAALGAYEKALAHYEEGLATSARLGLRVEGARLLAFAASAHSRRGSQSTAIELGERALASARTLGARDVELLAAEVLARAHAARGELRQAVAVAGEGMAQLPLLSAGLADEQAAMARSRYDGVIDVGVTAAAGLGDAQETFRFLEGGRAAGLLEGWGGRASLLGVMLPAELRRAEAVARAREREALDRYGLVVGGGDLAETASRAEALDAARGAVNEVVERIQREVKRSADVLHPVPAGLGEVQASLVESEALVMYGLLPGQAFALVVTRTGARVVALGETKAIEAAFRAAVLKKGMIVEEDAVARLRGLVVDPLGLGDGTRRVLVSPHGVLSFAPVALLFPGTEVAEVPSGTTFRLLRAERAGVGAGVLALGDPDVGARPNPAAVALYSDGVRSGAGPLGRLPSAASEARALGDVVLLGTDASEARLRDVVAERARWRSIHFACHALVDPERPTLSSLLLTPSGEDDGFLTALDVLRLKTPADLVVLSACETGKGKIYSGEGIVGLTRAFMFAGATRVVCSLWKVDDEATRALMVRFYELWNPRDGSKALGAAAALRAAQEHVRTYEIEVPDPDASRREGRSVPKRIRPWDHPFYWAAWVLWGVPE